MRAMRAHTFHLWPRSALCSSALTCALLVGGCPDERDAATTTSAPASAPARPVTDAVSPASAPHAPPLVDMRGCMVLPAAREKADGVERARADCPTKLHDETRREGGKDVTYGFTLHQARTDDVRARAVPNVCCYDKTLLTSP